MMLSTRLSLFFLATLFAFATARPGSANYPSEEENIIPDYSYDNENEPSKADLWKSIGMDVQPGSLYNDELVPVTSTSEPTSSTPLTPSSSPKPSTEPKVDSVESVEEIEAIDSTSSSGSPDESAEAIDAVRAVDVVGPAGAVAAVQAVEVVQAAYETSTEPSDITTEDLPTESGRALDDKPQADAPTTDQQLYGFSKFLHDLLQVPVQVMRSVSSYISAAFNSRRDTPTTQTTPEEHALTSAFYSQSF